MKFRSLGYLFKEGLRGIWSNRTMSFASVGVLISCLLLTGAAVLFSWNIDTAMSSLEGNNSITVYFKQGLPTLTALQVGQEIKQLDNIQSATFVSKDEAVKRMLGILGDDGSVLEGLMGEENFLPDACKISMKDLSKYKQTVEQIKKIEGVDSINDYSEIAKQLTNLDKLITTAGMWIVLLLSLVSLFIISNTIRVTMFSRRLEISIMKSVGATNGFIRIPFIVEGLLIGVLSGAASSVLLVLLYDKMLSAVSSIALFSPINIQPYEWKIAGIMILAGALFGTMGGMISIGKYLKKEGGAIVGW